MKIKTAALCICLLVWLAACSQPDEVTETDVSEPPASVTAETSAGSNDKTAADPEAADVSGATPPSGTVGQADAGVPAVSGTVGTISPSGATVPDGSAGARVCSIAIKTQDQVILDATDVTLEDDDTVLSVTLRVARENKIPMEYRGSGNMAYVEGIDNVYEFDHGGESGWIYIVNGEKPLMSCGLYTLNAGDQVHWEYRLTLD
jgi:hypothetical protein